LGIQGISGSAIAVFLSLLNFGAAAMIAKLNVLPFRGNYSVMQQDELRAKNRTVLIQVIWKFNTETVRTLIINIQRSGS
jgi:hypothetical protein